MRADVSGARLKFSGEKFRLTVCGLRPGPAKKVQGAASAFTARPLFFAPGNRLCVFLLETENDTSRDAQIVLRLRAGRGFRESRQQVVHFHGPDRKVVRQLVIEPAPQ